MRTKISCTKTQTLPNSRIPDTSAYDLSVDVGAPTKVDFQIVVRMILVLVYLQISCTTSKRSTSVLQNPGSEPLLFRYAAVTQNNGQQEILDGGKTYMLTHRNWRFEKFLTCKIQTNDLKGWVYQSGLADLKSDLSRFLSYLT